MKSRPAILLSMILAGGTLAFAWHLVSPEETPDIVSVPFAKGVEEEPGHRASPMPDFDFPESTGENSRSRPGASAGQRTGDAGAGREEDGRRGKYERMNRPGDVRIDLEGAEKPIIRVTTNLEITGHLVADGEAISRRDPLPAGLLDVWPGDPRAWLDVWGVEHGPLEKVENPELDLEDFWLEEEKKNLLDVTRSGTYEVKHDRAVEMEPGRTTTLKGRVIDAATGAGVPDATVVLFSTFYKRLFFYDHHLREVAGVRTGPGGRFEIEGFNTDDLHFGSAGKAFLTVQREGYVSVVAWYLETLFPGTVNDLGDVPLSRGGLTVRGRVVDLEGVPVEGAVVACTGEIFPTEYSKDQRYTFLPRFPHAVCGPDGRFEIHGILGRHWVSVHAGTDCVEERLLEFRGEEDPPALFFRVLAGGLVEGRVVDGEKNPVADAVITAGTNSTHSYADGSFKLENVEGDVLTLVVRHHRFHIDRVEGIPEGAKGVEIVMDAPLPAVVFKVREPGTLEPLSTVRIRFLGPIVTPVPESTLYVNEEGRHAAVVPEGARRALVEAEGHDAASVVLQDARDGDEIEVLLSPRGE